MAVAPPTPALHLSCLSEAGRVIAQPQNSGCIRFEQKEPAPGVARVGTAAWWHIASISPTPPACDAGVTVRAGEDMRKIPSGRGKGESWPLGSSGVPHGHKSDTGPLPARVSSQKLWARNGQGQDPAKEPRGGGWRPVSETRSFMSPTGPRISTVSGGECELSTQRWVDGASGPH